MHQGAYHLVVGRATQVIATRMHGITALCYDSAAQADSQVLY